MMKDFMPRSDFSKSHANPALSTTPPKPGGDSNARLRRTAPGKTALRTVLAYCCAIACATVATAQEAGPSKNDRPPPEIRQKAYVYEILRHLYRWYLEEQDIGKLLKREKLTVWLCPRKMKLDENDHSQFAEIVFPHLGIKVTVKKADYTIEETSLPVKGKIFKIASIESVEPPPSTMPPGGEVFETDTQEAMDFLFRTRSQEDYPDTELQKRIAKEMGKDIAASEEWQKRRSAAIDGRQTVYLAPISPVANEAWIYWENGRVLMRISSDTDLENGAEWDRHALTLLTYDLDKQVLLSLEEAPGSNNFLPRRQVGRVLFNCVVLGRREQHEKPRQDGQ